MKLKRILSPVDFSQASAAALSVAGALANALPAELVVLHAQRWDFPPDLTVAQTKRLQAHLRKSKQAAPRDISNVQKEEKP